MHKTEGFYGLIKYDLSEYMNKAIKKHRETEEHHSVYQLSSDINPRMIVDKTDNFLTLEEYGYYEIWSTKSLNKTKTTNV